MTGLPRLAPLGATLLVTLALSGCGGPPADASEQDFCDAVTDLSWAEGLDEDSSGEDIVDALQEWAATMEETGTPEDIPDDARDGFEITIDELNGLDPDDFENLEDVGSVEDGLADEDQEKVDALDAYKDETCEASGEGTDPGSTE